MAVELYRASLGDDRDSLNRAYTAFMRAVESLDGGPSFLHKMLGPSRRDIRMLLHELPRLLDTFGSPRLEAAAEADDAAAGENE